MTGKQQNGFTVIEGLIILVVIAALVGAGIMVAKRQKSAKQSDTKTEQASNEAVEWSVNFQTNEWFVEKGKAPDCKKPFTFDYAPVDMSQVMFVLLPGQYRGFNYKPHGGFSMTSSTVNVKMPMDAKLVGITRYLESPDKALQYVMDFESDCGIAFRFDHLHALTPAFQAFADKTPAAKLDDTRSSPEDQPDPIYFKAGEAIATEVGHPDTKNYGFDFGVYDLRARNEVSKNQAWQALHQQNPSQEWYGVCWFDMLPGSDAATANALSKKVVNTNKPNLVSDYCPGFKKTLEVNGGKPTDG